MKNKIYMALSVLFIILLFYFLPKIICSSLNEYCIYNTSVNIVNPIIGLFIPLFVLSFLTIILKNINSKSIFLTILVFGIVDFVFLSGFETTCSAIICFQRAQLALITSSLFSIIYFVFLIFKNKKKST
jgi:hypothetical protein